MPPAVQAPTFANASALQWKLIAKPAHLFCTSESEKTVIVARVLLLARAELRRCIHPLLEKQLLKSNHSTPIRIERNG